MITMTTKQITNKLASWGDPESEYYQKGIKYDTLYDSAVWVYNLTQTDRVEIRIDNTLYKQIWKYSSKTIKDFDQIIQQKLEPLRNRLDKSVKALDSYFTIAGQQAKEIIEEELRKLIQQTAPDEPH